MKKKKILIVDGEKDLEQLTRDSLIELKESKRYLSNIIESSADAIISLDANGNVVLFNEGAERIFGYRPEEVIGKNIVENGKVKFYRDLDTASLVMRKLKENPGGKAAGIEAGGATKEGRQIFLSVSVSILKNEKGEHIGTLGILKDITERKRAEEEIRRNYDVQSAINALLHYSLQNIPLDELLVRALEVILSIPWLVFESRGSIFLVEAEQHMLILKAQNRMDEPLQSSCSKVPFGRCICGRAALTKEIQFTSSLDERHEISYEGIYPHGHYCVPILSGSEVLGVINLYVKAGHQREKREEEFLHAVADVLAGIIKRKQIESEVHRAKHNAELYLDIISHDINNLNQIGSSYLELLLETNRLDSTQRKYARRSLNSVRRSIRLIENVRLLQEIGEASEFLDIDLNEVILEVIEEFSINPYKKVEFNYTPRTDLMVKADPLIKEIFVNLAGNSIKHSGESVVIGITVEETSKENRECYRVCIEDDGNGIPDEKKQVIFQRFEVIGKKARNKGLGLYIVKSLVEKYGGELWVEDRVKEDSNAGARFCFTIPKA